jgi:hypothetical protein
MHIDRLKREALKKPPAPESLSDTHMSKDDTRNPRAGVNPQPPVHQFRMKPVKQFWG